MADEGALTYAEANRRVNRYVPVLRGAGVRRGDVVGLLSHDSIDMLLVLLATVKLGAVSGLLNYNQRGDVLDHSLRTLGSRVLVLEEDLRDALDSVSVASEQNILPARCCEVAPCRAGVCMVWMTVTLRRAGGRLAAAIGRWRRSP